MAEKKCICQICTCPDKLHKCKYEAGEESIKRAAEEHCQRCGCRKKFKPYVPVGAMETATTYNTEYQPKLLDAARRQKPTNAYNRLAAPMDGSTTYNSTFNPTFTSKPIDRTSYGKKQNTYRPMGDMFLETTYSGAFHAKVLPDSSKSYKAPGYLGPMAPMNLDTTYGSEYTQKTMDLGFTPCCPCCDPKAEGYEPAGEEDGHSLFVKRG